MKTIIAFLMLWLFISCGYRENKESINTDLELREKELELRQRELDLKEKELNLMKNSEKYSNSSDSSELPPKKLLKELYSELKSSVYIIYAYNDEGVAQGSAFVIDNYGLAISNYHVVKNATNLFAENYEGRKYMITQIYEYNKENDYVLFRIGEEDNMNYAAIANSICSIGDDCFTIGTPQGLSFTLSKGIVSGYRANNRYIQTTTEITHGSSGGPLMNEVGEVIGITTRGIKEANLNFAINIKELPIGQYINKKPYQSNNKKPNVSFTKKELENFVSNYYDALSSKNYSLLRTFYSSNLRRYYSKYNIKVDDVIDLAKDYNTTFKVKRALHKINWNSFRSRKVEDYYVLEYIMDYTLDRYDRNKNTHFILHIVMVINSDAKIISVYENILDKA